MVPVIRTVDGLICQHQWVNMGWVEHVQCSLHLWGRLVPKLQWELAVCHQKCNYEECFKGLDCSFYGINLVDIGFDKHQVAFLEYEIFFDNSVLA